MQVMLDKSAFHDAVRGQVDYSHVPTTLDTWLARASLHSATALRMLAKKRFHISVSCRHLPRAGREVHRRLVLYVRGEHTSRAACKEARALQGRRCDEPASAAASVQRLSSASGGRWV